MENSSPETPDFDRIQLLRSVFDLLPFAIFCKDYSGGKGSFVIWNRQAEVLWGLTEKEVVGKTDRDFFKQEQADFFRSKDLETLQTGSIVFVDQEPAETEGKDTTWVRTWKIPLSDANGTPSYLIGVSQDITALKRIEAQLRDQSEKAALSTYLMEQAGLVQQIAHQLNNPLAISLGRCTQLSALVDKHGCPEDVKKLVDSISDNVRASAQAIDQMLHLSENKAGAKKSEAVSKSMVHDLMNILAIAMGRTNQAIRLVEKAPSSPESQQAREKLNGVNETLKRMELAIRAESSRKAA